MTGGEGTAVRRRHEWLRVRVDEWRARATDALPQQIRDEVRGEVGDPDPENDPGPPPQQGEDERDRQPDGPPSPQV